MNVIAYDVTIIVQCEVIESRSTYSTQQSPSRIIMTSKGNLMFGSDIIFMRQSIPASNIENGFISFNIQID